MERNSTIDFVKGIGVLIIILVHSVELFATESLINSSFGKCILFLGATPVAPLLMIIFGFNIYKTNKTTLQLLKRGILILFLGFTLNIVLNANLLYKILTNKINLNPYEYIFGADILHLAGISLIVCAFLKPVFKNSILFSLIGSVLVFCTSKFLLNYNLIPHTNYANAYFFGNSKWSYFPFFNWFAYVLTGIFLFQLTTKHQLINVIINKINFFHFMVFVIFLALTLPYSLNITSNLQSYYHHGLLFFVWATLFLLGYTLLFDKINKYIEGTKFQKVMLWLGKNITQIYFLQWVIIGNFGTSFYKFTDNHFFIILIFIAVLLVSSFLTYIFKKL